MKILLVSLGHCKCEGGIHVMLLACAVRQMRSAVNGKLRAPRSANHVI
jgi:hypothetical protein